MKKSQGQTQAATLQTESDEPRGRERAEAAAGNGSSGATSPRPTDPGPTHAESGGSRHVERTETTGTAEGGANSPPHKAEDKSRKSDGGIAEAARPKASGKKSPKDRANEEGPVKLTSAKGPTEKSQRMELPRRPELEFIASSYPEVDPQLLSNRSHPLVLSETQFHPNNKNKGSVYNEILASIGLDSPTSSYENMNEGGMNRHNHEDQPFSTPIRNSASNLIALGKHVLTPRQGKSWTYGNQSPLGR